MIKKIFIISILITLFTVAMYSAEEQETKKLRTLLGVNIGLGVSWQQSTTLVGGEIKPQFSTQFGARGLFYFTESVGIMADLGAYIFQTSETNVSVDRKYTLHYFYISTCPFITFKKWYFSTGLYFGFLGNAKYTENGIEDTNKDFYTKPDIGFMLGIGYMFNLSKKIDLLVNLDIKYSLNNFRKDDSGLKSGKIFAIMIDISVLFEL